eukprot:m.65855 g.65855  ORF g.65855 m.65855 type:complete len:460 (+) comp16523_c0_seq2:600-1979(+)
MASAADEDEVADLQQLQLHQEDETDQDKFSRRKTSMADPSMKIRPLEAVVTFLDGTETILSCPQGKYTTGEELREMVARDRGVPAEYSALFAIWIVSGSLQLQMKAHHMPFKVLKKWPELLQSYTHSDPFGEVPVMYFKRDAIVHQGIERKIKDPIVLRLLFDEMSFNVLYSLYPCEFDEAAYLAAVHLQLARGNAATKNDIAEVENCLMPEHLRKSHKPKAWIKKVLELRKELSLGQDDVTALHVLYLQHGWSWPYYGCTFFFGDIEQREVKHVFQERPDEIVRVGVNLDGVHVINDKKNKVKLSLDYSKLSYNSYEDSESGESCFLIEYDAEVDEGEEPRKEQLVVWTQQATMIDTLVTRFIEELGSWQEFLQQRRKERGMSLHPDGVKAKGRTEHGKKSSALDRFNTIVKRSGGGMFTLGRMRTRKQRNAPTAKDFDQSDAPQAVTTRQDVAEHPL